MMKLTIILTGLMLLACRTNEVNAQSVYGVAAARTLVVTGSVRSARRTAVVATPFAALPSGYIGVLPGGYRVVTIRGARCYFVNGIHYRPLFYQGRTVYVRLRHISRLEKIRSRELTRRHKGLSS